MNSRSLICLQYGVNRQKRSIFVSVRTKCVPRTLNRNSVFTDHTRTVLVSHCILVCELSSLPPRVSSIHFLHLGSFLCGAFNLLQRRQIIIITQALIIIVNAQSKLDHTMNTACKLSWLIKIEPRGEQGGVKQQPDQVLHGLIRLIC